MSDDLVERLRDYIHEENDVSVRCEAARRIEALERECAELKVSYNEERKALLAYRDVARGAIKDISCRDERIAALEGALQVIANTQGDGNWKSKFYQTQDLARRALEGKP